MKSLKSQVDYFFIIFTYALLLTACVSATPETQVQFMAETPTKIVIPTSTLTEIPTQTKEAMKEKGYASCFDPELIAQLDVDFIKATGETVPERIARLVVERKMETGVAIGDGGAFGLDMVFVGTDTVSLEHLNGASPNDRLLCAYFSTQEEPDIKIATIVSFVLGGDYYVAVPSLVDIRNGWEDFKEIPSDTFDEAANWFESADGPQIGDRFLTQVFTFHGIGTYEELDAFESNIYYTEKEAYERLLKALDNDYLARVSESDGLGDFMEKHSSEKGDVGVFVGGINWQGK